ncbi:MAG: hypothetical protein ACYSUC_06885 [Planctomycetota bacterium]|jgi:hypothetical protein
MGTTDELKAARINGDIDDGPALITKWSNLEASIRNIFGVPADTAMSEAMQVGTGPNITMTGTLTLANSAPTADLMAASKRYFAEVGGGMGFVRARAYLTGNQAITDNSIYVPWDAADINEGDMWDVANPTRLTIPAGEGGHYLVGGSVSWAKDSGNAEAYLYFSVNRSRFKLWQVLDPDQAGEWAGSGIYLLYDLSAGEYIEFYFGPGSGGIPATLYYDNATLWACKVS